MWSALRLLLSLREVWFNSTIEHSSYIFVVAAVFFKGFHWEKRCCSGGFALYVMCVAFPIRDFQYSCFILYIQCFRYNMQWRFVCLFVFNLVCLVFCVLLVSVCVLLSLVWEFFFWSVTWDSSIIWRFGLFTVSHSCWIAFSMSFFFFIFFARVV